MAAAVYLVILICAIASPRSKVISALAIVFMFVMYSFVYYEGDLQNYQWIYEEGITDTSFEPGFNAIIFLCRALGMSFTGFRMILAAVFLFLMYRGITKYTDYSAIVLSLIIIFPFFVFTSVMRSGIACAILLNAYIYLIDPSFCRKGITKYVLFVLVAALFHYSAALMLVFIVGKMRIDPKAIVGIAVLTIVMFAFLNFTDIPYRLIALLTSREKTLQWLSRGEGTANFTGAVAIIVLLTMNYYIARRSRDILESIKTEGISNMEYYESKYTYNISVLLLGFIPLMCLASPYLRVAYMLVPLFVSNGINAVYGYKNNVQNSTFIPLLSAMIFGSLIIWRIHYDLPYITENHFFFQEMIETLFVIY